MLWYRQAIFYSEGDKFYSAECRIWTRDLWNRISSRLNACWLTDWAIDDQAKSLLQKLFPVIQRTLSPFLLGSIQENFSSRRLILEYFMDKTLTLNPVVLLAVIPVFQLHITQCTHERNPWHIFVVYAYKTVTISPRGKQVCHNNAMNAVSSCTRDLALNAPSQWVTKLHCNVRSHWLDAYTNWSLLHP